MTQSPRWRRSSAEQRVSLNQWVAAKLADRRPTVGIDDLFD
jgi:hypothetical protein